MRQIKTYLQNRNRLTDLEEEFMVMAEQGRIWGGGTDWEFEIHMNTLLYLK